MEPHHQKPSKIWVVSELYYPEETSTGYYLTGIAEGLAEDARQDVHVLCGRPNYAARGQKVASTEEHQGVSIRRCWSTTWDRNRLLCRAINTITLSLMMFWHCLWRLRPGDRVLVVTNPPALPFVVALATRIKRAQCVLLIHDVYPDVLTAIGMLKSNSAIVRLIDFFVMRLYRSVSKIIVLGRDMRSLVIKKDAAIAEKVVIIPNWADHQSIQRMSTDENPFRAKLGLRGNFLFLYSGNMGRTHDLESLVMCAKRVKGQSQLHFLLVGQGAKRSWLERTLTNEKLSNVTLLDRVPRNELPDLLNSCDVALVAFQPGMAGVSVPSRMYNLLAAEKPILAICDLNSELAQVLEEEQAGWVVPPQDIDQLTQTVLAISSAPETATMMGANGRTAAETKYSYEQITACYREILDCENSSETHEPLHQNAA